MQIGLHTFDRYTPHPAMNELSLSAILHKFFKPLMLTFNKFRVLTNAKMEGHAIMPLVSEMMVFKLAEYIGE
tara:strand:- start:55 stop:270 length:216 start_codon:yes stop_codon:yes gene_type:complete